MEASLAVGSTAAASMEGSTGVAFMDTSLGVGSMVEDFTADFTGVHSWGLALAPTTTDTIPTLRVQRRWWLLRRPSPHTYPLWLARSPDPSLRMKKDPPANRWALLAPRCTNAPSDRVQTSTKARPSRLYISRIGARH
jgi:hypothetical protein